MDNINAPGGGNAPQGDQGQGGNIPPTQDNAPEDGQPPAEGQPLDQGGAPAPNSGGELQMPPEVGGDAQAGEAPPNQAGPPPVPEQTQEAAPPADQGPVEDVLEGAEGGGEGSQPSEAVSPGDIGGQPEMAPSGPGEQPPAGETPTGPPPETQEIGPEPELPQEGAGQEPGMVVPQSQPDFSGPDQAGTPQGPGQVPGQPPQPPGRPASKPIILIILVIVLLLLIVGAAIAYFLNYLPIPFLDNLLGRNQQAKEQVAQPEQAPEENQFPEDEQRKSDLVRIKAGLEDYFGANQAYPVSKSLVNISDSSSSVYKALVPDYLTTMPSDPASPGKYYGYQLASGTSFEISAALDNKDDPDGIKRGNLTLYILTNVSEIKN